MRARAIAAEQRVATAHAGVSINDLTDEQRIDTLSGVAALSGVPVTIEAIEQARVDARSR